MIYIVIPAYKENQGVLLGLVSEIRNFAPEAKLILVDDGNILAGFDTAYFNDIGDIVIRHPKNLGYRVAIRSGFEKALTKSDCTGILKLDADGQYPAYHIPEMIEKLQIGYKIVSGSRYMSESTILTGYPEREQVNRTICKELNELGVQTTDPFTGYRLFSRYALEQLMPVMGNHVNKTYNYGLSIETTLNIHLLGLSHVEVACELYYPTLKQFPGEMASPEWRLNYYRQMYHEMLQLQPQELRV